MRPVRAKKLVIHCPRSTNKPGGIVYSYNPSYKGRINKKIRIQADPGKYVRAYLKNN